MAYCKAGRFGEAEAKLSEVLDVLGCHGARVGNSQVMYWYLVARHRGDRDAAMKAFINT